MHSCRGGWEGRRRWWKGDTGVVELGGFGGSREAGQGSLRDVRQASVGWTRQRCCPAGSLGGWADWDVSSDSQARPAPLSGAQGLCPLPCGPVLLADISLGSPLQLRPCPPSTLTRLPLPLCCPLSQFVQLSSTPRFSPSGQMGWCQKPLGNPPHLLDAHQSSVSSRVGSAPVGILCPGSLAKLAEDPALLRRTCQVQLILSV